MVSKTENHRFFYFVNHRILKKKTLKGVKVKREREII